MDIKGYETRRALQGSKGRGMKTTQELSLDTQSKSLKRWWGIHKENGEGTPGEAQERQCYKDERDINWVRWCWESIKIRIDCWPKVWQNRSHRWPSYSSLDGEGLMRLLSNENQRRGIEKNEYTQLMEFCSKEKRKGALSGWRSKIRNIFLK